MELELRCSGSNLRLSQVQRSQALLAMQDDLMGAINEENK